MRKTFLVLLMVLSALVLNAQDKATKRLLQDYEKSKPAFEAAYRAFPTIPQGLLEAVSYTNTHFHHLTDADYGFDDSTAMPRSYGLMGLVMDGKNCFRENLHVIAKLSGIPETDILTDPAKNVLAYAAAFSNLLEDKEGSDFKHCLTVVEDLSELPVGGEKDAFVMNTMLYSVCNFLNDEKKASLCGFVPYALDLKSVFGDELPVLSARILRVKDGPDYPGAIWNPAPECNFSERSDTTVISSVVVHYTEGSYAGSISWFLNCDSQVSAHYVIRSSDGQITQMVREADKAWHARTANAYSIGIEHEAYGDIVSYFTPEMYGASADLVRDICQRHEPILSHRVFYRDTLDSGICLNNGLHDLGGETSCVKIRGHQHYPNQSHTDPGPYWDWNYYYKLINQGTEMEILEGESGVLNHQDYPDDERRLWLVRVPQGHIVQMNFESFELETDYDFLWIYDGEDEFAPKIGRWNTQSPGTVISTGNVMCLEFRSDCFTTAAGWRATWRAVKPVPVESITIEPALAEVIMVEGQQQFMARVLPDDATFKKVRWSVSDENVITVDRNGLVRPVNVGNATVTATSAVYPERSATAYVTVLPCPVASIALYPTVVEMNVGDTVVFTATLHPEYATNQHVTWRINDESVASIRAVNSDGLSCTVEGMLGGKVHLSVITEDGQHLALADISVNASPDPFIVGVFPNPVSDLLHVNVAETGLIDIEVYDAYGNCLLTDRFQKTMDIDVSQWRSGVYFLRYGPAFQEKQLIKIVKVTP